MSDRRKARIFEDSMKRALLLIVAPALLVALGFAQTPAASVNTDQTIKGCLGGTDGNYTVAEDGTDHVFKISNASVDIKQHLGHDVTLIGHKASGASSAAVDDSFVVTELNMISEHCAAAAAAPTATTSTPAETIATPDAAAAAAATVITPADTSVIPAADATSPTAAVSTPAKTEVIPAISANPPAETVVTADAAVAPPSETSVTPDAPAPAAASSTPWDKPATDSADPSRLPNHSRRRSATPEPTAMTPAVTDNTPAAAVSAPDTAAASPTATASTPSATAGIPDAAATKPVVPARRGALWLLIALAVLVIVIGTLVPFLSRWRKQKSLERTGAPNLSFTREASSDEDKSDKPAPRKAA
jgi:hypothetical protein